MSHNTCFTQNNINVAIPTLGSHSNTSIEEMALILPPYLISMPPTCHSKNISLDPPLKGSNMKLMRKLKSCSSSDGHWRLQQ